MYTERKAPTHVNERILTTVTKKSYAYVSEVKQSNLSFTWDVRYSRKNNTKKAHYRNP
jgi:hypothetical protein